LSQHELSQITVQRAERPARRLSRGATKTGRVYADFLIDGRALSGAAHTRVADLISRLGWGSRAYQDDAVAHLLLSVAPDYPWDGGRTALYVCPEDGDLHCGAITLVIERHDEEIVWRDFGYETGLDIDPPELDQTGLVELGPYRFAWAQYESAIRSGYGLDGFNTAGTKPEPTLRSWLRRL
jgi:hypothetical protein